MIEWVSCGADTQQIQRCLHSTAINKFIGKRKPQLRKGVELGLKKLYRVSLLSTTLASLAGLYEFVLSN
jgi:hypothetical protein